MPIISITFYMVIIRVGLANRANQPMNALSLGYSSSSYSFSGDRRSKLQIDTKELKSRIDNISQRSSQCPISATRENHRRSEIKFDDIKEEV